MAQIHPLICVSADATTLADVIVWVDLVTSLGTPLDTELFDGAHLAVEGSDPPPAGPGSPATLATFGSIVTWTAELIASGVSPTTKITRGGDDLCVDLPVQGVELIGCADCPGDPQDLLIHLHDTCRAAWDPLPN
jgi:hypothetical protein